MRRVDTLRALVRDFRAAEVRARIAALEPVTHEGTHLLGAETISRVAAKYREIAAICDEAAVEAEQRIVDELRPEAAA